MITYLYILLISIINKEKSIRKMRTRNTRQKSIMQEELESMQGFFSAENLFSRIEERRRGIGIATVYRFLGDKERERQLHSYVCNKRKIYSSSSNSHCHYICQICGRKEHIGINDIGTIKKGIKGTICHFQIDVTGVCERCLGREKEGIRRTTRRPH